MDILPRDIIHNILLSCPLGTSVTNVSRVNRRLNHLTTACPSFWDSQFDALVIDVVCRASCCCCEWVKSGGGENSAELFSTWWRDLVLSHCYGGELKERGAQKGEEAESLTVQDKIVILKRLVECGWLPWAHELRRVGSTPFPPGLKIGSLWDVLRTLGSYFVVTGQLHRISVNEWDVVHDVTQQAAELSWSLRRPLKKLLGGPRTHDLRQRCISVAIELRDVDNFITAALEGTDAWDCFVALCRDLKVAHLISPEPRRCSVLAFLRAMERERRVLSWVVARGRRTDANVLVLPEDDEDGGTGAAGVVGAVMLDYPTMTSSGVANQSVSL
eukprot:PhM_4_TR5021/c0_g1_i1/m.105871